MRVNAMTEQFEGCNSSGASDDLHLSESGSGYSPGGLVYVRGQAR